MAENRIDKRASNIELFRVIVMFMILCGHYVFNSSLLTQFWGGISKCTLFYSIFGMWGKVGINCFILITGYFMCTSNITLRKFLKLYLEIVFYKFVIYVMFDAFGEFNYSFADILLSLTPFWRIESDSFVSAYLMWWLFIPFLNVLVNGVNRKKHMLLISLCIFCFSVLPLLPFAKIDINPICWFSTIYFVASYIRFYPQNIISNIKCLAIVTCFMMLLAVLGTMLTFYASNDNTTLNPYWLVMDYNAPLALFISVSSFLLFKNIKMKHSKLINTIGATTFGILLIHAHSDTMRKWLWEDIINTSIHYLQFWYAIVVCILIFIMCSAIDYTRIKLIENPLFRYIDKFLENNKWTNKI